MENISLSSASKLAFIKWLVVMLCISFSYSHADDSLSPDEKYQIKEVEKNITRQTLSASSEEDFSKWFRNEQTFVVSLSRIIQTAKEQDYVINELSQSWDSSKFKIPSSVPSNNLLTKIDINNPWKRIASYKKETQSNYNTYYFKVSESAEIDLKLTGKRNYQSEHNYTTFCSDKNLDTVLYLLDMDYNLIDFNDDHSELIFGDSLFTAGHHLDLEGAKKQKRVVKHKKPCRVESGISKYLNKGEYIIIADTYSPIDAEYTLSIGGLKGTFSKLIKKPVTKTISEEWPKATMENWLSDDNPKYTFHIPNQQKVNIRINSGGTPFLYLLDGHGSVISSEATNISKNLNRGNYILIAGNKDDKRGEFTIDLTASSDTNLDTKKLEKLEFDEKCLFCPKLKNTLVEIEFHNHKPEFWLKNQAWNEHSQFLSADPEIAVFNKNNQLELKKFGKTIITVLKVNDKNIIGTKTFELNVTKKKQKIEIKKASLIRTFGNFNDFNLTYHTTTPLTLGSQKGFSYQLIYGADVATVREDGSGYVKKPGEFAVEVTANETRRYKEAKKWFTFHVKKGILALSDSIKQGSDPFEIDKIYNIFDTLFPRYKKYQKFITFKNMSEGIIKFEDKEGNLKFIKPGEARIKYEVTENIFFEATSGFITLNLEKTKVPKVDFEVSYEQGVLKTYSSNLKSFEMTLGNNAPSKIKITPKINKESSDLKIIYKSLDKDIADVSDGGVVSIKSAGTTIIEMYREGDDYFLQSKPSNLHLLFIRTKPIFKFSKPWLTKSYGDDKFENKLITNSSDGNGLTELNYTSTNKAVATVDDNSGVITIVGIGETTIKAYGEENGFYTAAEDSFQLYVLPGLPKITFENKETQKNYGDAPFKLNIKKKEGSSSLEFESLNKSVAKVTKDGHVTIVGWGNAKITATSGKNEYFDEARGDFEFKVEKGEQDIELFGFEDNKIDKVYGNPNFTIRVDNKNKHDSWSDPVYEIDNNTVASVSKDGTVKIKGAGQANITVKRKENNWFKEAKKSIVLTVKKAPQEVEFVSKNISKIYGDQSFQVFLKNNKSDRDKNVQYSVSNEKIAKVNEKGIVSILGAGNFKITATKAGDEDYSEDKDTLSVSVDKAEIEFEFTTPMIIKNLNDEPFNLSDYIKFKDLEKYPNRNVKVEFEEDIFEHISIEDGEKATIEKEGFIQIYGEVKDQNFRSDKKFITVFITSSKVSYSPTSPKDNETTDGTHHEKETKSGEVDLEPRQDSKHKPIELNPIKLDSQSETELKVNWSGAKNQLESTSTSYTHATIFYSEQSLSEKYIADYANFAEGNDVDISADKHLINKLNPNQRYFVVMVFWNKGQDMVARTAEAKFSTILKKTNDDAVEEPENEKESGKTKKEEALEDKPLRSQGTLIFLDEEDQLTESWIKAIEELEKIDFTYGTIDFYNDYQEYEDEHLYRTSFVKGDDLKSLIFDNIFSLRDDDLVNSGMIRLFDTSGELLHKYEKLEINSKRQLYRHNRYKIRWNYDGNDSNDRKISLFYTLDKKDGSGLNIPNADRINISKNYFEWDIEAIPEGTYYIYAIIDADDKNLVYSEFPITIEHNHGLVMDCSGMYNYPGGEFNAPLRCHKNIIALVNSFGKIEPIGKKEHIEDASFVNFDRTTAISEKVKYQKIYPNSEAFLALTQAANSSNDADKEAVRLTPWGGSNYTGIDKFYRPQKIYSTDNSFTVINQNTTVKNAQEKSRYYIKIMPELSKSIVSKADSSEDQVTFSVHYDVDEADRQLTSFVLAMSYNSEKLIWDGVQNNDLLGIAIGPDSKNDINTNPIQQWQDSSYGELRYIKNIEKVERENLEIYNDEDADRMVIFFWMQNFQGQGTFKDVRLGFVGDKQFPVKLLTTTFRLRPDAFATNGDIRVNFGRMRPKSEVASWPFEPEHLILKSNSQTDSTPSVSESNSPYITDWRPPYIPRIAKVVSSGEGGYVYDDIKALIANDSINALVRPFKSDTTWIKDNIHKEAKTFTHVVSNGKAKAALTKTREIMTWNKDALTPKKVSGQDRDFIKIYPSSNGFTALRKDGGGVYWDWDWDDNETIEYLAFGQYLQVIAFGDSVAGLKKDGTIAVWGENTSSWIPSGVNYKSIYADGSGNLAALSGNGQIGYWQRNNRQLSYKAVEEFGGNHSKIYSNKEAFAALKNDGSVIAWGDDDCGGADAPTGNDFIAIYSSECSFVAVTKEGKYSSWGEMGEKGGYLYDGKREIKVEDVEYDTEKADTEKKADTGSKSTDHKSDEKDGSPDSDKKSKQENANFSNIHPKYAQEWFAKVSKTAPVDQPYRAYIRDFFGVRKDILTYTLVSDNSQAEKWLSINPTDATISGTPRIENIGTSEVTITAKDSEGNSVSGSFTLTVFNQTVHVGQKIGGVWKKLQHKDVFDVPFELPIIHDFSDSGDDDHFGVVINYDSKKLKFLGHKNILEPNLDYVKPHNCGFKVSDDTDKCILMNWEVGKLKDIDDSSKVLAFLRFKPTDSQFSDSVIYFTDVINTDVINPETYHGSFRITSRLKDNKSDERDGSPNLEERQIEENGVIKIFPESKSVVYNPDDRSVVFPVRYLVDTEDISTLVLVMHYDSSKLKWNGLLKDSVLGLRDPKKINSNKELIDEKWRFTKYGEFMEIYHYQESHFDDGDDDTDMMVGIRWMRNTGGNDSFDHVTSLSGFAEGPAPVNEELFKTSFTQINDLVNDETRVNFSIAGMAKGNVGRDYVFEPTSLTITGPTDKKPPNKVKNKVRKISVEEGAKLSSKVDTPVDFSVTYSADTKDIPNLGLYIFYDSDKLKWNGIKKDSILGLRDPKKINSNKERVDQSWKDTEHGEFKVVLSYNEDDYPSFYNYDKDKVGLKEGDDGSDATDTMIMVQWKRASLNKGTFKSGSTGFVENIPNNLRLFKTSFTPKPGFSANEKTVVNFRVAALPEGLDGWDYAIEVPSLTITGPNSGDAQAIQLQYEALSSTELKVYWSGIDQDILDSIFYKKGYIYYSEEELEDLDFDDENLADTLKKNGGGKVAIESGEALISNLQHSKHYYLMMVLRDGEGKFVASSKQTHGVYIPQYTDKSFKFTNSKLDGVAENKVLKIAAELDTNSKYDGLIPVSVRYTADSGKVAGMSLFMHYNDKKLKFEGIDNIWGFHYPPGRDPIEGLVKAEEYQKLTLESRQYGEFEEFFHEDGDVWKFYDDNDENTTKKIILQWGHSNLDKHASPTNGRWGFVKEQPKNLELFKAYFRPMDGFARNETTKINFTGGPYDSVFGKDYQFKATPLTITNSGKQVASSVSVDEKYVINGTFNEELRDKKISFYYAPTTTRIVGGYKSLPKASKEISGAQDIPLSSFDPLIWDTSRVPEGVYSIFAVINGNKQSLIYSPETVTIEHPDLCKDSSGKLRCGKYIKITPKDIKYDQDTRTVSFSVDYDVADGNRLHEDLWLLMHYDSSKLVFNGLKKDSILVTYGGEKPERDLVKKWSGRDSVLSNMLENREAPSFDKDNSTDRIVTVLWGYPSPSERHKNHIGNNKGFIDDLELPAQLYKASFTLKDNVENFSSTDINFTGGSSSKSFVGNIDYSLKSQPVTITESADGKVTATGGKASSGATDGASLDSPYVQITTDSLNIDDDTVEFSVSYDVSNGNERIRSLTLKMFYDSSQLTWNGLEGDSVLGIHPNKQPLTDLIKYWTSRYGEFQIVKDLTEEELEESDNDDSTDRIVYLLWLYNNAPEKRTFSDWAEYKGFLGDEKLPVKLFTTSFVRADESSGPTRINFKSDSIPSGTMGYGYDFKSQSVTITESADGKVTATGGKAIYRPANGVSVGKVDVADDSSLTNMKELIKKVDSEKLITEGRKKVSSEYIKIIPGVPNNKAFFEGSKAVAIPVFYGVSNDKRDIGGLGLEMSYDSNKLIWRGVRVGSVLGLHSYSKSKLGLSADGVIDNWYRVQHGDGYGELDFLVDNEKLDSGYGSANRGVYFAWIYNHSVNKRTFDDWLGDKGFIGDQELPVKLFTAIFSPVDGFEGSTSIDFKVAPIKKDNIGSDYGFKSIPVDITFD